ncbi:MAG: HEAT repeat domain-containing protein [Woeseiaceae bacterium]|nr:HEAT repeat domain-containing protein [Woeseiaceae bacterium]
MSSGSTANLKRGAALGLALLLCASSVSAETTFDSIKRQHRQESFIVIEHDGGYRVLFLGGLEETRIVDEQAVDVELLYDAVDQGDPLAVSRLSLALESPDRETRLAAIRLLGEIDSADARAALEAVLHQSDVELRLEVVEAIADTPGAEALLRTASEDGAGRVASAASEYLGERQAR